MIVGNTTKTVYGIMIKAFGDSWHQTKMFSKLKDAKAKQREMNEIYEASKMWGYQAHIVEFQLQK